MRPQALPNPIAEQRWEQQAEFVRWDQLAIAQAIAWEGDMGSWRNAYTFESAWALQHPVDDYEPPLDIG